MVIEEATITKNKKGIAGPEFNREQLIVSST
jgi:hypothetical protein